MKRVLCIILVMVALTVCFASPAFADVEDPEPPGGEGWQNREHAWCGPNGNGEMITNRTTNYQ